MAQNKKKWSDLTQGQKAAVIVGGIVELILTSIAANDLRHRPKVSVRGPKWLWSMLFGGQPFGPVAYLTVGRTTK